MLELLDRLQLCILRAAGFRPRWVHLDSGRAFALEYRGTGRHGALLVQHGISASGKELMPMLLCLRPHFSRILVPELPGHGFSDPPSGGMDGASLERTTTAVLDALVDEPMVVFGNSLGGLVAIRYARSRPERVRGLILSSPGGAPETEDGLREFLARFRFANRADARVFVERLFVRPPWFAAFAAAGVMRRFAREPIRQLLDAIRVTDLLRVEELRQLAMPVRVVWGRQDRLMLPRQRDWFRAHLPPHGEFDEPDGIGHCPYLDRPRAIARHVVAFAERL